nr:hypothetical protein [uncultured Deefgea sp.]
MTGTTNYSDEVKAKSPCLIIIEGRYALRVRAIPFVTHDVIGAETLACWLAYGEKLHRLGDIQAFHLINGMCADIPAQFWAGIVNQLETLERELRTVESVENALEAQWLLQALQILPVAYIWLDEFEAVWLERFTPTDIRPIHTGHFVGKTWVVDNRASSWTLNLLPYLTASQSALVLDEWADDFTQNDKRHAMQIREAAVSEIHRKSEASADGSIKNQALASLHMKNNEPQITQINEVNVSDIQGKSEVSLNWKMRIQAEAALRWTASLEVGAKPTKQGMAPELAKWCRENEIKTDKTNYPTATYIQRHVLQSWNPPPKTRIKTK